MLRLLLLDVGNTLIREGQLLPHVSSALEAMAQFETQDGEPLQLCIVSDYHLAEPVDDADAIEALFEDYRSILEETGLREWFEPVDERVTLSTHAGVMKPERAVFEVAVTRSGIDASLKQCLFITENRQHVEAARALGMTALVFDPDPQTDSDFHDWSEAPLLVRSLVSPKSEAGLSAALNARLSAEAGVEITHVKVGEEPGKLSGRGRHWVPLQDAELGPLDGAHVQLPVQTSVTLGPGGRIERIERSEPDAEAVAEARGFVRGLVARNQVALSPDDLRPGQTHEVATDEQGRRCLRRKRF